MSIMIHQEPKQITITSADLPLCCPLSNQEVWDAHPRVYLQLEDNNQVICPYCSTTYVLDTDN